MLITYDDFQKVVGLPRGPVFPGHLCSASKDRWTAGLKTRLKSEKQNENHLDNGDLVLSAKTQLFKAKKQINTKLL